MEKPFYNNRKGKILLRMFVTPDELQQIVECEDGNFVRKLINEIHLRGDLLG